MAAKGGYDWDSILSSNAARRAKSWIGRALEGAPSPQAPIDLDENMRMMAVCQKRLDASPNNVYAMITIAYHLIYIGEHREAILLLDRAIVLDPDNRTLYEHRGKALLELGLFEDALVAFKRACSCSPHPEDPFNIGITLGLLGHREEAGKVIEDGVARDPEMAWQRLHFCNAYRALEIHGPHLGLGLDFASSVLHKKHDRA